MFDQKTLSISWGTIWKLLFLAVAGWVLFAARDVITALLLAIVISTAFDPAVSFLRRKGIPRVLGTLAIYLIAIFLLGLVVYALVPVALSEFTNLLSSSSKLLGPAAQTLKLDQAVDTLSFNLSKLTDLLFSGNISLIDIASGLLGGFFLVVAIFALSFYLTVGRDGVERFLVAILPSVYEAKALSVYARVTRKIGKWLTGQLILSFVVGFATFFGLWILGVKYSLLLGFLAGFLELIPYVGPIFTGSLAVLIAFGDSVSLAVYAFILFIIINQLENHVLVPLVMRYTTALNPVVILTALLLGGKVFGIAGLILAVPVAVLFQEIIEDWTETKQVRRGLGL